MTRGRTKEERKEERKEGGEEEKKEEDVEKEGASSFPDPDLTPTHLPRLESRRVDKSLFTLISRVERRLCLVRNGRRTSKCYSERAKVSRQ